MVILNNGFEKLYAIVVDPQARLIFWADAKPRTFIERAGYNGENRMVVYSGHSYMPNTLVTDKKHKRLYWHYRKQNSFSSVDYNGEDYRIGSHIPHLLDTQSTRNYLDVFEGKIYFKEEKTDLLISVNPNLFVEYPKRNKGEHEFRAPYQMTNLKMYHREAQPVSENKCFNNNCKKNEICLPKVKRIFDSEKDKNVATNNKKNLPYTCFGDDDKEQLPISAEKSQFYSVVVYILVVLSLIVVGMIVGSIFKRRTTSNGQFKYELPTFSSLLTNETNNVIDNTQNIEEK